VKRRQRRPWGRRDKAKGGRGKRCSGKRPKKKRETDDDDKTENRLTPGERKEEGESTRFLQELRRERNEETHVM